MARQRKDFKRNEGFRDANLYVIAAEGEKTENQYFEALKLTFRNPKIQIEVLEREDSASSPSRIIELLDEFQENFNLKEDDELWLLIDRDRWEITELKQISQLCRQKGYHLAFSNPCFELWLLLHVKDFEEYSEQELDELFQNKKVNKNRNYLEQELITILGSYNKSKLNTEHFISLETIQKAIKQAKTLHNDSDEYWFDYLATRVYVLVEKLIEKSNFTEN